MGTTVLVLMLVGITLVDWRSEKVPETGFVPDLWLAGSLPGWVKVAAYLWLVIVCFTTILFWSYRPGLSAMHRLAIAGGGIFSYAWLGRLMEPDSGPKAGFDYVGSVFLA